MDLSYYRPRDDTQGNSGLKILFSVGAHARINCVKVEGKYLLRASSDLYWETKTCKPKSPVFTWDGGSFNRLLSPLPQRLTYVLRLTIPLWGVFGSCLSLNQWKLFHLFSFIISFFSYICENARLGHFNLMPEVVSREPRPKFAES